MLQYSVTCSSGCVPSTHSHIHLTHPQRHRSASSSRLKTKSWLYCTVLYCTVLCCTVLYCTVLYCTVLYCNHLFRLSKRRSAVLIKWADVHSTLGSDWSPGTQTSTPARFAAAITVHSTESEHVRRVIAESWYLEDKVVLCVSRANSPHPWSPRRMDSFRFNVLTTVTVTVCMCVGTVPWSWASTRTARAPTTATIIELPCTTSRPSTIIGTSSSTPSNFRNRGAPTWRAESIDTRTSWPLPTPSLPCPCPPRVELSKVEAGGVGCMCMHAAVHKPDHGSML